MIDMKVRPRITRFLTPMGKALAAIGVTPTLMTVFGLSITIFGSVMIANGLLRSGAAVVLLGSALDGLDGSIARATDNETDRGAFLDSAFHRLGQIAAFAGLALASAGEPLVPLLIVLAIGGAMLVPYMRARAEAQGFSGKGGLMGRAERIILFTGGILLAQVEPMLWVFVVTVWFTAGVRFATTYRAIP